MTGQERNDKLFITDAIRQIFDINSPIYIPWGENVPYKAEEYPNLQLIQQDESETLSEFGTPVLGTITFEGGEYNTYDRRGAVIRKTMGGYTLPYSCIADFKRDSNVTKTDVLGNTGTVKELYGKSDWNISIRGIALDPRNGVGATAREQIDTIVEWCNLCDAIPVVGRMFNISRVDSIVIESFSIQPVVGRWGAIPFQIEAVSDVDISLIL